MYWEIHLKSADGWFNLIISMAGKELTIAIALSQNESGVQRLGAVLQHMSREGWWWGT
jgi:hypothetical protein